MADEPDWDAIGDMHPTVRLMQDAGIPMTADNYADLEWPHGRPRGWRHELPAGFEASPEGEGLAENPAVPTYGETETGPRNATAGEVPNTADDPFKRVPFMPDPRDQMRIVNPDAPFNPALWKLNQQDT